MKNLLNLDSVKSFHIGSCLVTVAQQCEGRSLSSLPYGNQSTQKHERKEYSIYMYNQLLVPKSRRNV